MNKNHKHTADTITISTADNSASMTFHPDRGAIASSLIFNQQQLLFLHDFFDHPHWPDLPGGWPFCFPACGRLSFDGQVGTYQHNANTYHLPIHGFAWQQSWRAKQTKSCQVTLSLHSNDATRAIYPFEFSVHLEYTISHNQLTCLQTYTNRSNASMPYSCGFHPYFKTPWPQSEKTKVELHCHPEKTLIYNSDLTDIIAEKEPLTMPRSIADPDINEQLSLLSNDHQARLSFPNKSHILVTTTDVNQPNINSTPNSLPYLQLYTDPNLPFFCVEHWSSPPNALNSGYSLRLLESGQSEQSLLILKIAID